MELFKKKRKYEDPIAEIEWFTMVNILAGSGSYGDGGDDDEDPFGDGTNGFSGSTEF